MAQDNSSLKLTIMIEKTNGNDDQFTQMTLDKSTDIATLKLVIQEQMGISINNINIFYKNKLISNDNNNILSSFNMTNNDVLIVKEINNNVSNNFVDLSIPSFGPNSDIPTLPKWLQMSPKLLQEAIKNNPKQLNMLLHQNPELANAILSQDTILLKGYMDKIKNEFYKKVNMEQRRRAMLNADPLNPEYQKLIANEIQQENINTNYHNAMENMPEAFARVVMLYVPMEVEGNKITAFIDSGAQSTIMSASLAKKCNIMRLLDRRFAGIAKGVGTAKILGKIHIVKIKFGNTYFPCSITVLENSDMEFLFGLDMLRRHQGIINLRDNQLEIGNDKVKFLQEKDIPGHARNHFRDPNGKRNNNESKMDLDEDKQLQNALMQSVKDNNNNNNNNNNSDAKEDINKNQTQSPNKPSNNSANNSTNNANAHTNANTNASSNANANNGNNIGNLLSNMLGGNNIGNNRPNNNNNNLNENDINTLINQGYTRQQAINALRACGGNVEYAASYLFQQNGGFGF